LKNGVNDLKKHRFLNTINLGNLLGKKISSPYKPILKSDDDVSNFGVFDDSMKESGDIKADRDPFLVGLWSNYFYLLKW